MESQVTPDSITNGIEVAQFGWVAVLWWAKRYIAELEELKKSVADKADTKDINDAMERKFDRVDRKLDKIYDMMYNNRQGISRRPDYNIGDRHES